MIISESTWADVGLAREHRGATVAAVEAARVHNSAVVHDGLVRPNLLTAEGAHAVERDLAFQKIVVELAERLVWLIVECVHGRVGQRGVAVRMGTHEAPCVPYSVQHL
eukprot:scaffold7595_cov267-Pinguiococcus_pyrenoidosus.AAC.7